MITVTFDATWWAVLVLVLTDKRLLDVETVPAVLGLSALAAAGHAAVFLLAAGAVDVEASLGTLTALAFVVLVAAAVPANVAGWGPREGAAAWVFALVGLGAATGTAVATAYGVLSRGLLAGSKPTAAGDFRAHLPRLTDENRGLVDTLARIAAARGVTPAQLAIAWSRARYDFVTPIVGSRTRRQLADALGALDLRLSPAELSSIESALPAAVGTRYPAVHMPGLDSER